MINYFTPIQQWDKFNVKTVFVIDILDADFEQQCEKIHCNFVIWCIESLEQRTLFRCAVITISSRPLIAKQSSICFGCSWNDSFQISCCPSIRTWNQTYVFVVIWNRERCVSVALSWVWRCSPEVQTAGCCVLWVFNCFLFYASLCKLIINKVYIKILVLCASWDVEESFSMFLIFCYGLVSLKLCDLD